VAAHNVSMSFAYVLSRAARSREKLSVLDWGGTFGHYYLIARAVLPEIDLDYHCFDVPSICESGRERSPEVTFHDNPADAFAARLRPGVRERITSLLPRLGCDLARSGRS